MADDDLPHGKKDEDKSKRNKQNTTDHPQHLNLDLGDDLSRKLDRSGNAGTSAREDNPFSFKHFLRSDSATYQNKGARPKVYNTDNRSLSVGGEGNHDSIPEIKSNHRIVPEYSSALPDFVQDHLVIEQCYLGNTTNNLNHLEINNLPDFTQSANRTNFDSSHCLVDELPVKDNVPIPLDLPLRPDNFPLDLPVNPLSNGRGAEVGNSKSLPDFLADSHVNNQEGGQSNDHSPESENDRLRLEIGSLRRQLAEETRRADNLNRELDFARSKEHDYTQNLARALEQVELNLEKSKRRATSAENTISKLKQEIASLREQMSHLEFENKMLRGEEAAGGFDYNPAPSSDIHSQRLANELRTAANTAEHSLRQLLTGVENLRLMASTLENRHRIEEERRDRKSVV